MDAMQTALISMLGKLIGPEELQKLVAMIAGGEKFITETRESLRVIEDNQIKILALLEGKDNGGCDDSNGQFLAHRNGSPSLGGFFIDDGK